MSGKSDIRRADRRSKRFVEGVDYYINDEGKFVFTAHYLSKRGYCCKNGCKHCPYGYEKNKGQ